MKNIDVSSLTSCMTKELLVTSLLSLSRITLHTLTRQAVRLPATLGETPARKTQVFLDVGS